MKEKILKRLSLFDIFVILLIILAVLVIGIRYLTKNIEASQDTEPVKITFKVHSLRPEIAEKFKEGQRLIINGNYLGDIENVVVEPMIIESVNASGERVVDESNLYKTVTFDVVTDAVLGETGAIARGVQLNINGTYTIRVGYIRADAILTDIQKIK